MLGGVLGFRVFPPAARVHLSAMGRASLPTKVCVVCERPFTWRKKWERDWANVKYCSKRCARSRVAAPGPAHAPALHAPKSLTGKRSPLRSTPC